MDVFLSFALCVHSLGLSVCPLRLGSLVVLATKGPVERAVNNVYNQRGRECRYFCSRYSEGLIPLFELSCVVRRVRREAFPPAPSGHRKALVGRPAGWISAKRRWRRRQARQRACHRSPVGRAKRWRLARARHLLLRPLTSSSLQASRSVCRQAGRPTLARPPGSGALQCRHHWLAAESKLLLAASATLCCCRPCAAFHCRDVLGAARCSLLAAMEHSRPAAGRWTRK